MNLSYYNDAFDLKCGDIVFVEGKLEGLRGRVVDVAYNFKIKLSDYKRVISVADTNVQGEFFFAGSHFVTFDRSTLPYEKVITWFKSPATEDEIFVSGNDDCGFLLHDLSAMSISRATGRSRATITTRTIGYGTFLWTIPMCGPLWRDRGLTSWRATMLTARSEIWFATASAASRASINSQPCCS